MLKILFSPYSSASKIEGKRKNKKRKRKNKYFKWQILNRKFILLFYKNKRGRERPDPFLPHKERQKKSNQEIYPLK
jgi:hypothetical protein